METNKQISVLMDCLDLLVAVSFLKSDRQRKELIQQIIASLEGYPKRENMPNGLAAYLYVSMACNTAKLAHIGYIPFEKSFRLISNCLEMALSLLTDKGQPQ